MLKNTPLWDWSRNGKEAYSQRIINSWNVQCSFRVFVECNSDNYNLLTIHLLNVALVKKKQVLHDEHWNDTFTSSTSTPALLKLSSGSSGVHLFSRCSQRHQVKVTIIIVMLHRYECDYHCDQLLCSIFFATAIVIITIIILCIGWIVRPRMLRNPLQRSLSLLKLFKIVRRLLRPRWLFLSLPFCSTDIRHKNRSSETMNVSSLEVIPHNWTYSSNNVKWPYATILSRKLNENLILPILIYRN